MKKIFFIVLVTIVHFTEAFGQDNIAGNDAVPKNFIGVTGGYAMAFGNITKNDYNDNKSGYASTAGFNVGLDGAYYFHKHIGIGGVFSTTSFYTKGLQTLADGYKQAFDVDYCTVVVSGRYTTVNFLVGPYFTFRVKKFTFDARLAGGWVMAKTPLFSVALEDQKSVTFYQKSATANAFGFQAGIGIRYPIIKNFCVKLSADFYYSDPDFKITNENRIVNTGRLITEYKQPVMGLYLNFGIAYQLAGK